MSLVEVTIALGMMGLAGTLYMTHMQNAAKNDANQKSKQLVTDQFSRVSEFLRSGDVCNYNSAFAFKDLPLQGTPIRDIKSTQWMYIQRQLAGGGGTKHVLGKSEELDNGKVFVSDLSYTLKDIRHVGGVYTHSANIEIKIELQTCLGGGLVVVQNRVFCPIDKRRTESKTIVKNASFNSHDGKVPATIQCAETEDDLFKSNKDYTNIMACVTEARALKLTATPGTTSCGIKVDAVDSAPIKVFNTGVTDINIPANIVPGSMVLTIVGGGGGGGGPDDESPMPSEGGKGGHAAQVKTIPVPGKFSNCKGFVGAGGGGGGNDSSGGQGEDSRFECDGLLITTATGGGGGETDSAHDDNGEPGASVIVNGTTIPGGQGGQNNGHGQDGNLGSGGGGASDNISGAHGGKGGNGYIELKYKTPVVVDPNGVLAKINKRPEDI